MDNNSVNKHILENTVRHAERKAQGRTRADMDTVNRLLTRAESGGNHTKCNKNEAKCKEEKTCEAEVYHIEKLACRNNNFREMLWTGRYLQTTLMSIGRGGEIGAEIHADTDQYIRIEHGCASVLIGEAEGCLTEKCRLYTGDAVFIPAGTWHNIVNTGRSTLKLSSTYAPPHLI